MDQQMKQELMSRHRARLRESIAPGDSWGDGDPIGRMIACWIIDIVADARELELSETMAALRGRSFGDIETPAIRIEVDQPVYDPEEAAQRIAASIADDIAAGAWTCDPKDVEVSIGDGVGGPRQHEGFAMTTELTGSIERASVTITAEFIEGLWSTRSVLPKPLRLAGEVGIYDLWSMADGSVWATNRYEASASDAVMVVKPDPEAGQ